MAVSGSRAVSVTAQNPAHSDCRIRVKLKAPTLCDLIAEDLDGKWPEQEHGKFYKSRAPPIPILISILLNARNGYTYDVSQFTCIVEACQTGSRPSKNPAMHRTTGLKEQGIQKVIQNGTTKQSGLVQKVQAMGLDIAKPAANQQDVLAKATQNHDAGFKVCTGDALTLKDGGNTAIAEGMKWCYRRCAQFSVAECACNG
ncbi:hypothetical protein M422DRAFT_25644 [Sphaerobolus stellatus SS14]|nr:hypothetical protein M422DRAFT_25644 [Sphaerobolus stellatus SS14]